MRLGRLEISGGAMAALALLYYLDDSGVTVWVLVACVFHELGHWWAIRALGGQVARLRVTCAGAELRLSSARPLPAERLIPAALAGPGANLAVACGSACLARRGLGEALYFFAGLNLGLALFNLLPAAWLDGGRVLTGVFSRLDREELGERVTELCSDAVAALLLAAGLVLLWQSEGRNFTLLIAGLWMTAAARRERRDAIL